jgi:hypothetical protein
MTQGKYVELSAAQRTELWSRWKRAALVGECGDPPEQGRKATGAQPARFVLKDFPAAFLSP